MALTELALRSLRDRGRPGKVADKDGLYLRIDKAGRMYWRTRLRRDGRETELSYGPYPEVSLAKAREAHRDARALARQGGSLVEERKKRREAQKADVIAAVTLEEVAREWFAIHKAEWASSYACKVVRRLEADVFPYVGNMPISTLSPADALSVLRRVEERGVLETAHRVLVSLSQICRHAVATGRASSDPTRDLRGVLRKPVKRNFAAITTPDQVGPLLRAIHGYSGTTVVRAALQLATMLMLRPGELRNTRWEEIDIESARLVVPAQRMKRTLAGKLNGSDHVVPLPRQAVAILRELHMLTGSGVGFVFPGEVHRDRPMSENTINAALRRMGFDTKTEITGHGFRAMARTILDEHLGFDPGVIEAQLAHAVRDSLGRAYNRTQHLAKRAEMMQMWADYLDKLRTSPLS